MSVDSGRESVALPWPEAQQVDRLCDRFESALQSDRPPVLEEYLAELSGHPRQVALRELLLLEWEYSRQQGRPPELSVYRSRFAEAAKLETWFAQFTGSAPSLAHDAAREPNVTPSLRVRCPHCRQAIDDRAEESFRDIVCAACGNHFSLVGQTHLGSERRRVAHFDLLEPLGAGRFGHVWLARDVQLDRLVAVKMPHRGQLPEEDAELFLREARAAAQLRHPQIVNVHEVGRDGDTMYIVSDYVPGPTLAQWLKTQQPTPREAAELIAALASTLQAAHSAGVIHRDIKPSNVILDRQGTPHVMDFGLARRDGQDVTVTAAGQVFGTPAYMSPEQARGAGDRADGRTDVYSLGVMLYEMLTGSLPFQGNVRMQLQQVLHEEPRAPRRLNDRVPRDLEMVCLKAMSKEPAWRYATAEDLAADLRRFLAGEPVHARAAGPLHRAWLWCRRPARIVEAGWTMQLAILLQLVLALLGAASHVFNWTNQGVRLDIAGKLLLMVGVVYLPLFLIGRWTVRRSLPALWAGLITQGIALGLAGGHLVDWLHIYDGVVGNVSADVRLRHWVVYTLLAGIPWAYYVVAICAWYSNRETFRWMAEEDKASRTAGNS
jgi:serine/threonine-protein kinase